MFSHVKFDIWPFFAKMIQSCSFTKIESNLVWSCFSPLVKHVVSSKEKKLEDITPPPPKSAVIKGFSLFSCIVPDKLTSGLIIYF